MKLEIEIPEHQYNNIIALNSLSLGRVPYKGIIMYAINAIKRAKPLPQEPRRGHWILDESDNSIECSLCGCKIWANDIMDGEAHFCPNCGAKMVKEQTEG